MTEINPVPKPKKPTRLKGKAMSALRWKVFMRAEGCCEVCGEEVPWDGPWWLKGDLAHIKSRGAGGDDSEENCRWECSGHRRKHTMGSKAGHK